MLPIPAKLGHRNHKALLLFLTVIVCFSGPEASATRRYPALGLALRMDRPHNTLVVSCKEIPGFMEAMVMPFTVRQAKELNGLRPGTMIDFTLVVEKHTSYAENIRPHVFKSGDQEPLQAERMTFLNSVASQRPPAKPLQVGKVVPDFTLTDQNNQPVEFSRLGGRVVAITFMYTKCPLPNYCFRFSNNFGMLQRRFGRRMGKDLVLLSITFDPLHDQPEVLAKYAATWKANPIGWHFLTGPAPEVQRVSHLFALDSWPDMERFTHTQHTVVIDRQGKLVTNIEGNDFSAQQLGDLLEAVMNRPH